MLPVVGAVIAFSRFGLGVWLGVKFATEAHTVLAILAIGILFNSSAQLPYAVIQARGNARLTAAIHVSEFILYAPILILLVKSFGIGGAAAAWSLRALLDFLLLSYFANKEMFTSYAPA
jgi:O-antigen/teichoic acid export membrane protein